MKNHNIIINNLLDEHECIVICDEQEPDLVLGFAMYENDSDTDILHYLYVRKGFRGRGLAKILLNELKSKSNNCSISHLTNEFRPARLKSLYDKVIYNPYARIK